MIQPPTFKFAFNLGRCLLHTCCGFLDSLRLDIEAGYILVRSLAADVIRSVLEILADRMFNA